MYSYSFDSNPNMSGMLYGRITELPSGVATYEVLGTTYATKQPPARGTRLITPSQFDTGEQMLLKQLRGEVLTIPTEVEDLEALVREATNAWRSLLKGADVERIWTNYDEVMKTIENKTESGLILPLEGDPLPVTAVEEFDRYRATSEEMLSIRAIEGNVIAMATRAAPGDYL